MTWSALETLQIWHMGCTWLEAKGEPEGGVAEGGVAVEEDLARGLLLAGGVALEEARAKGLPFSEREADVRTDSPPLGARAGMVPDASGGFEAELLERLMDRDSLEGVAASFSCRCCVPIE